MKKVTLGGDRLGAGKKQKVELQGFERSTHNLSNAWRSTMSAGTLVPFMVQPALPGDVWEINLDADVMTHPTLGPLLGSMKVQLDTFTVPMRLYNSWIHNNKLGIGNHMETVMLPDMILRSLNETNAWSIANPTQYPINNSHLIKYLGISGVNRNLSTSPSDTTQALRFNAIPLLGYWDIFKNYYANKQEENAYVISTPLEIVTEVETVYGFTPGTPGWEDITITPIDLLPSDGSFQNTIAIKPTDPDTSTWNIPMILQQLKFKDGVIVLGDITNIATGSIVYGAIGTPFKIYVEVRTEPIVGEAIYVTFDSSIAGTLDGWEMSTEISYRRPPQLAPFKLTEIDDIREAILGTRGDTIFNLNEYGYTNNIELIKKSLPENINDISAILPLRYNQEGLLVKTYQSDIFNNWLDKETISGTGGINDITKVDTSAGYFNIDTLQLAYKVYRMLNQITVSGGSYDDWQSAVYDHERFAAPEIPMYEGGLSKELVFQEIYSNSTTTSQPLGTLAGKGVMSKKHKGGHVVIHVNELSFIMGIISITPRIDYSQGNDWWVRLRNYNSWHKPHLDQIGFQDLLAGQMAWFGNTYDETNSYVEHAVGKQPAWLNYMTNYNRTFGNFADQDSEMFMTLNRRFEMTPAAEARTVPIKDATTYIDPSKFNFIFAETSLDAMNYWVQIAQETTVRRKISAKVMPNL
ncbi:MAG: major capsid protein [Microviridae sp.]|nr:MAG: major capsid protein [Microviridae sp.]